MSSARPRRVPVELYNAFHRALQTLGRDPKRFSGDALVEAACKASGLDDLGDDNWREGFDVLLRAYNEEANLKPFGRFMVQGEIAGILMSRLGVVAALAAKPEILETRIERPVFVLGLPRTGTTALHDLLHKAPDTQALDYWLAAAPGPRPAPDQVESDPRFKRAKQALWMTYYLDPSLRAIHNLTPDGPDECRHLLQASFTDDTFDSNATIPSYTSWYEARDMGASYAYHRDVLKLIQSGSPDRRWALKYPGHMTHLEVLLATYPDACIVQTHRDPGRVLPSLCSLVTGWRSIYEDDVDARAVGAWQLEMWAQRIEHAMDVRATASPAQFHDIHFADLVGDPVGTIHRMYEHFGFEWSDEIERSLVTWHAANPQGKFGGHEYSAQDYGLSDGQMAERFKRYIDHFDVPRETAV